MKKRTHEKHLLEVNTNSISYKIKAFFKKIFSKKAEVKDTIQTIEKPWDVEDREENTNTFFEDIKNIENEETKLLKLQKKYRKGEIKGEDLTSEEVNQLCKLYDRQIEEIRRTNMIRRQKILEYKKELQEN